MQEWIKQAIAYSGLTKMMFIFVIIGFGFFLSRVIHYLMNKVVNRSALRINVDPTNYRFLKNAVSFLVFMSIVIVIFTFIPEFNKLGMSLMASAGLLAAIIGFAAQQAFSNIVSGIFVVIFKPFGVGDYIRVGNLNYGEVEDITLRHTVIRNPENRRVIIPNSVISSETILNSSISDLKICSQFEVGISYSCSIDKAIAIIQELAGMHPNLLDNRSISDKENNVHPVNVRVVELAEYSVRLRIYVWAEDSGKAFVMKCDLMKSIKENFEKNNIEIPFPYRNLVMKNEISKNK